MRLRRNGKAIVFLPLTSDGSSSNCIQCRAPFDTKDHRRMGDACGHEKCLACLLKLKVPCDQCLKGSAPLPSSSKEPTQTLAKTLIGSGKENCAPAGALQKSGFKCYTCGNRFPSRANLAVHLTTHRQVERKTPRPRTSIEKRTRSSLEMEEEEDSMFIVVKKPAIKLGPRKPSSWAKPVRCLKKLKDHIYGVKKGTRTQTRGELLWTCRLCDSRFYLFQQLQLHKKLHSVNFKLPVEYM